MASAQRIRRTGRTTAAETAAAASAPAAPEPAAKAGEDLNDANIQAKILMPETIQVEVNGVPILLHPLPALQARAFVFLVQQAMAETSGRPRISAITTAVERLVFMIGQDDTPTGLLRRFCDHVARATYATATPPLLPKLEEERERIFTTFKPHELSPMVTAMFALNEVGKALKPKK